MKNKHKNANRKINKDIAVIVSVIILFSLLDVFVTELIYKAVNENYNVPWKFFEEKINVLGSEIILTQWNIVLLIFGVLIFILFGIASKNSALSVSGIILFATGWEDIMYYLIQLKSIPLQLPWLDANPFISWTRILTQSSSITNLGLVISSLTGIILVAFLLKYKKK